MKKTLGIALIFWISIGYSQTNQQLINSIIKENSFHSDCVGAVCEESELYRKWVLLKSKLSDKELIELSKNEKAVLRAYSIRELIATDKYPATELLKFEISKSESVESFDGCLIDIDELASIVYHEYWNKIRIESLKGVSDKEDERNLAMSKRLMTDIQMEKLDSIIIYAQKPQNSIIYGRVFSNRIHKKEYNPRILELVLENNNFDAFNYLKKNYPDKYESDFINYFKTNYESAKFETEFELYDLLAFTEYLIESGDEKLKNIAVNKLRKDDSWKMLENWFVESLDKNGIKL